MIMTFEELTQALSQDKNLAPHQDWILNLAKPCVNIQLTDEKPLPHQSRFGGQPFVPADFIYPQHSVPDGRYEFLGQINFAEITPTANNLLPSSGLLSLFYAFDDEGKVFWRDKDYIIAFFWQDFNNFSLMTPPPEPHTPKYPSKGMKFTHGVDIPRNYYMREDWTFNHNFLAEFIYEKHEEQFADDYLLGYPSYYSLGYDPTPAEDWTALLTVTSYDELGWCWHDDDKLMVFIEKQKLAQKDFSVLRSDAG